MLVLIIHSVFAVLLNFSPLDADFGCAVKKKHNPFFISLLCLVNEKENCVLNIYNNINV